MSKQKDGKYLYKYYRKKTDSFLSNLNKAKLDLDSEIIHNIRVDIKKIRALFHLYEMIKTKTFKENEHYEIFKDLFKITGRIREFQVNINQINKYYLPSPIINAFIKYQKTEEAKLKKPGKMIIENFNLEKLHLTEEVIVHLFKNTGKDEIIKKCRNFIHKEFKKVKMLYNQNNSTDEIHKLRKHFRSLGEIADLLLKFEPAKKLQNFRKDLKSIENELGLWHDSVIFLAAADKFLKLYDKEYKKFQQLENVMPIINNNTDKLLKKISLQMNTKLNEVKLNNMSF